MLTTFRKMPGVLESTVLALTVLATGTDGAEAYWVERNCTYEVRVKSDSVPVRSQMIPDGLLHSRGHSNANSSLSEVLAPREARVVASKAARQCLDAAIHESGRPLDCWYEVSLDHRPSKDLRGEVVQWRVDGLRARAEHFVCEKAITAGHRGPIGSYEIYAIAMGDSSDVRRECSAFLDNGRYQTLFRGRNLTCTNVGTGARPQRQSTGSRIDLVGRWTQVWVKQGLAMRPPPPGNQIDLSFDVNNELSFTIGCNIVTATLSIDRSRVAVSRPLVTRRACPGPAMDYELAFADALAAVARVEVDGRDVVLLDFNRSQMLRLRR